MQLQLENTSTCNAACVFCPYPTAERWGGLMSDTLYRKIMDEAATIPQIDQICITGLGEPTLDPHLVERVRYARLKKPGAFIDLFTNGVHMTPARFIAVRDAGITCINFSLNAVDAEQHEAQMGLKGKFDLVCKNIDYAIAHAAPARIEVRAVCSGWTEAEGYEFYRRWGHRAHGGTGQLIMEGNWAGDNRTVRMFQPNESCFRALGQIYVLWDGRVSTCCFDPTGDQVFGDLAKQTIREIYNSPKYLAFREAHDREEADQYAICARCTRI